MSEGKHSERGISGIHNVHVRMHPPPHLRPHTRAKTFQNISYMQVFRNTMPME